LISALQPLTRAEFLIGFSDSGCFGVWQQTIEPGFFCPSLSERTRRQDKTTEMTTWTLAGAAADPVEDQELWGASNLRGQTV